MTTQISGPAASSAGDRPPGRATATPAATPTGNTYDKYGSSHPLEQRMMRGFMRALDEMMAGLTPRRILEIGVGEGHVMARVRERFAGVPLVGLDLPDDDLGADWRKQGLPCMFGDATTLPFPDDSFDLVLAIEVLEHVPAPDNALSELSRVCSGTFVASVPFEPIWRAGNVLRGRYVKGLGNTPGHVNHWTRWGFRNFVESRFHVQQVRSPLPWTMTRAIPK